MSDRINMLPLTDYELSVNAKMADIHRQSLIKKLERINGNTLDEIEACSAISQKARRIDDARLKVAQ